MSDNPLELPFGGKRTTAGPWDEYYGSYANVAAAKTAIPEAVRYQGQIVNVSGVLYWWDTDLTDDGLQILGFPLKSGTHLLPFESGVVRWKGNGVTYGLLQFGDEAGINTIAGFKVYTNNQTLGFSGELDVSSGKILTSQEVQYEQVSERDGAGNGWRREEITDSTNLYGFQIWKGYDNNGLTNGVISIYTNTDGSTTFSNLLLQLTASGQIKINLGSDATGDVYHRNASGYLTRRGTVSAASTASLTIDSDTTYQYSLTALAAALTIEAPTGTPFNGQDLLIRIKDNGTARALTWNGIFQVIGVTLPTTTVINKTMYIACVYNSTATKWDVIGVREQV